MRIRELYELFAKERQYLKSVSPNTLAWYKYSFRAFEAHIENLEHDAPELRDRLKGAVAELARKGLQPASINDYVRALNAFLKWARDEGHLATAIRLESLQEELKVIPTLTAQQVSKVLAWSPRGFSQQRLAVLVAMLLDTGLRISEALNLQRDDVDFDNLVMRVKGKGGRHRLVPMSVTLRKLVFRFLQRHENELLFPTRQGRPCQNRAILREFQRLAKKLSLTGVRFSPHTLRHTFAVNYLRAGGNVFYLQRILGHSTLEMTSRYLRSLGIDDLSAVHDRLSLLGRGK